MLIDNRGLRIRYAAHRYGWTEKSLKVGLDWVGRTCVRSSCGDMLGGYDDGSRMGLGVGAVCGRG
jgi:hypothetical protein